MTAKYDVGRGARNGLVPPSSTEVSREWGDGGLVRREAAGEKVRASVPDGCVESDDLAATTGHYDGRDCGPDRDDGDESPVAMTRSTDLVNDGAAAEEEEEGVSKDDGASRLALAHVWSLATGSRQQRRARGIFVK